MRAGAWGRALRSLSEWCWCILCCELRGAVSTLCIGTLGCCTDCKSLLWSAGKLVCSLAGAVPALPPQSRQTGPAHTALCSCEDGWCGAGGVKPLHGLCWGMNGPKFSPQCQDHWCRCKPGHLRASTAFSSGHYGKS